MSLANYTGLVAAAATSWMARSDLSSQADDFISLFESDFNSSVRVRQMEAQTTLASTGGYLTHPTNWCGWKLLKGTQGGKPYVIDVVSDEIAIERFRGDTAPPVLSAKVRGDRTYLYPAPASAVNVDVIYYEAVPNLNGTASTNWLLTKYPGAYLFGILVMSNLFVADERYQTWVAAYKRILENIKQDSLRMEWSVKKSMRMEPDIHVV